MAARVLIALAVTGAVLGAGINRLAAHREAEGRAAFPPEGRLIEVEGVQVHAVQTGDGPDLVLIHGASGNTRDFT
ncbi:MAG: alpha/beta fold hydrolase, partial [Shimia sp.]